MTSFGLRHRWLKAAVDCEGYPETLVIPEALWPEAAAKQAMRLETDPWEDRLRDLIVDDEPGGINANYVDGSQTDVYGQPRVACEHLCV